MNSISVRKRFGFSVATLYGAAQRLLEALKDVSVAPAVTAHLPVTFVAGFEAQIALVAQSGTEQSGATGTVNALTHSQTAAELALRQASAMGRRCAALAFAGQGSLLRSEFQVGLREPQGVQNILDRARKLLAACHKYSAELATHGWSDASMTALSAAIDALEAAGRNQDAATDVKVGSTASKNEAANALYKQCCSVQNAARFAYPASKAAGDPAVVTARARFLLDEFPPRLRALGNTLPAPAPAAAPVPAAA